MPGQDWWDEVIDKIRAEATERGVPMWRIVRDWRERADNDFDRQVAQALEDTLLDELGDHPGWNH